MAQDNAVKNEIKLVSLNMGRGLPGLEGMLKFLQETDWDVACIQDVRETHIMDNVTIFGESRHFVPMTRHLFGGVRENVGIGIFSRKHSFVSTSAHAFWGDVSPVKDLKGVTFDANGNATPHNLEEVRSSESRLAVFADLKVGDHVFRIGTLHGVWVPAGKTDNHQRLYMGRLRQIMNRMIHTPFVLAGDFNAARGGEIYNMLVHEDPTLPEQIEDAFPGDIPNTIDWKNRGKVSGPDLVVDYILKNQGLSVSDVKVHFGVSDHAAITATISQAK